MSMPEFPAPTTNTSLSRYSCAFRNSDEWISSGMNVFLPGHCGDSGTASQPVAITR